MRQLAIALFAAALGVASFWSLRELGAVPTLLWVGALAAVLTFAAVAR
jgi:hypothetical protein